MRSLRRNHNNFLVFGQIARLVRSHNNIFIVRENKNRIGVHLCDRVQHILRARIHRLTALDQIIHTQILENLGNSRSDGYRDKADRLAVLLLCFPFSIYYGEDIKEEEAEVLRAKVEEEFPDCDVELNYGGQPIYYYIISVE